MCDTEASIPCIIHNEVQFFSSQTLALIGFVMSLLLTDLVICLYHFQVVLEVELRMRNSIQ